MKIVATAFAAAAFLASALPAAAQEASPTVQVIHAGALIRDGDGRIEGPSTITVQGGRIAAIEQGHSTPPPGATLIDLTGKTVMPGLIDLHVHLGGNPGGDFRDEAVDSNAKSLIDAVINAEKTVRAGFTTVRDLGGWGEGMFALRQATAEGDLPGPRIVTAGSSIAIVGGHGDVSGFRPEVNEVLDTGFTCTGATECMEKVRLAAQNGADVIKITATGGVLSQQGRGLEAHFTSAEMEAIVEAADALGLNVAAHAHGARGIEAAARAGIDTIEHGTYLDREAARAMAANGTVLVPTLMAFQGVSQRLGTGVYTPTVEEKVRAVSETARVFMRRAREWGVPIAFGTDAGVFEHGLNAGEFALMMGQGMSSREAVASATTNAARVLNMENEIGRLAPGLSADLIALDGNPLDDATLLENVDWVMVRGRALD